jgi:hypothetical protein
MAIPDPPERPGFLELFSADLWAYKYLQIFQKSPTPQRQGGIVEVGEDCETTTPLNNEGNEHSGPHAPFSSGADTHRARRTSVPVGSKRIAIYNGVRSRSVQY